MAINSKISLGWKGKEYKIKLTMDVIGQIEDHNIHKINKMSMQGNPPMVLIAKLLAFMLNLAGESEDPKRWIHITDEEMYSAVHYGDDETSQKALVNMVTLIIMEIMPEPKKKPTIPKTKKKAKAKKK